MSWSQRIFLMMTSPSTPPEPVMASYAAHTNSRAIDTATRSSKGYRSTGLAAWPAEYTGLNGEFDPQGLAKRVAQAFDRHPIVRDIQTLCLLQQGNQISLLGKVADAMQLRQVVNLADQIDGVESVDVSQVVIEDLSPVGQVA